MNTAHTPGPWTMETTRTSVGVCFKVGPFPWKNGKLNHACIYADYPGSGPHDAELVANARLIAAAPDLLEALVNQMAATYALLEWATEVPDDYLDGEPGARAALVSDLATARKHANEARAAVAKATGATHEL